jgi:hypothetical protein
MIAAILWLVSETLRQMHSYSYLVTVDYSDVFGLAGYVATVVGLGLQVSPFWGQFRTKKTVSVSTLVVASGLLLFIWLYLTVPVSNFPFMTVIVGSSYLILQFAVIALIIPLVILFSTGTFWKPFLFFASGIMLAFLSEIIAIIVAISGATYPASPSDLLLDFAYLTAACGFYLRMQQARNIGLTDQ